MAEADRREGEGFLARWSRLKREGGEAVAPPKAPSAEPPAAEATPAAPARAEPVPAPEPEAPVDLAALPKLEDLTPASDITAFLRKGVPTALRNAALRRMWSLDPTIRDYIGPMDYGWDWNTPGGVPDYVADIGETPAIRHLVERMLTPSPPRDPPPPRDQPGSRPAEPVVARLEPAPEPAPAVEPPTAGTAAERAAGPAGPAETTPEPRSVRPRHGGAMPA
jgi:hypothetical protein